MLKVPLIIIIHAIILSFLSDLQSNLTSKSDTVSEEKISESKSTKALKNLQEPEKEPGKEGKKALKRDAATLGTAKKTKKTKLEKSLEMLCESFKEATEKEMQQNLKIEEERQKREMEFHLKLRQLEMERRREERQHELSVLQILFRQAPSTAFPSSYQHDGFGFPAVPGNRPNTGSSSSSNLDESTSYFQL